MGLEILKFLREKKLGNVVVVISHSLETDTKPLISKTRNLRVKEICAEALSNY